MTYIITYDMAKGGSYDDLFEAIKSYGTWAKINKSTWAIVSESKSAEIRDNLGKHLPKGSSLFIVKSASVGAWRNVECSNEWLKKNL
jgi:uncharacterized Zn ribbon protein